MLALASSWPGIGCQIAVHFFTRAESSPFEWTHEKNESSYRYYDNRHAAPW